MADESDHITGKTGLTPSVTLSKNGASFSGASGAVTESGNGWYALAGNATDRNTLGELKLHATASGADPADVSFEIVTGDPFVDAIQTAVSAIKTQTDKLVFTVTNQVDANVLTFAAAFRPGVRKNTALTNFMILMTDSVNHNPATGKTVTVTRSVDGGAFGAGTLGSVTEVSSGFYKFDFGAGDLNGGVIALRATASGCDDLPFSILTNP